MDFVDFASGVFPYPRIRIDEDDWHEGDDLLPLKWFRLRRTHGQRRAARLQKLGSSLTQVSRWMSGHRAGSWRPYAFAPRVSFPTPGYRPVAAQPDPAAGEAKSAGTKEVVEHSPISRTLPVAIGTMRW